MKQLNQKGLLPKKFSLKNGHPIIDEKGILRLGGRHHHSNESYQTKHPIVLPNKYPFTRLVAAHFHFFCFHAGRRMTLATLLHFCGPVYLKPVHRKAPLQKIFIAVYICFATKAVHLELVCDLSNDAFIASLRRFIARRGIPEEIQSDNGTNFQCAKTKLNEMYRIFNSKHGQQAVLNECSSKVITW
ncbi:uncharacterized protein LOC134222688 [Armigeres subalbatus]|uniref:uncharacterized protein LOC134222688 n=1 Tax=Armigeres subalbatus TaxID=124917 RepID=UPI002ED1E955